MKRTDCHRPGAIIPAHYAPVLGYNCATSQDGWPVPSFNIICQRWDAALKLHTSVECDATCERSCVCAAKRAHENGRQVFGSPGKCGSCGAWFVYGELWRHVPTGDLVHLGHDCAQKYELMMDRSEAELANGRNRAAVATQIRKAEKAEQRTSFLEATPGLAEAFEVGNAEGDRGAQIIADIAARFVEFASLSEKQVALVLKLAHEIRNPKPESEQEHHVPAPVGKGIEFVGTIVSAKARTSEYGITWKITVKVTTDAGVWLAWGTAPSGVMNAAVAIVEATRSSNRADAIRAALVGMQVDIKAGLERPSARDASEMETDATRAQLEKRNAETHFVFMSRPAGHPVTYNHPIKSAKRLKAEAAFEKLVYTTRSEILAAERGKRYVIPQREVIGVLALVKGITRDAMIAAAAGKRGKASVSA